MDHISYWVGTSPESDYPAYAPDGSRPDVVVIGGGIAGLTTAILLQQAGASVAVVEARRIATGVTGYTTAKVTALHGLVYAELERSLGGDAARVYGEANWAAVEEVARLVAELDIDCDFERFPAFTYTEKAGTVGKIEAEVEAAVRAGLPAAFTRETDLPYPVAGAIRLDGQAQFHPRRYCLALAEAIVAGGGQVFEQTRVVDLTDGQPCLVATEHGDLPAGDVVVATHLPIVDPGALFARTHPMQSYALGVRLAGTAPQGMYLSADEPTRSVRPVSAGSSDVVLGGESHKVGHDPDTRSRYEVLEAWARDRFKVADIPYRWSAHDYMPADGVPFIGRLGPNSRHVLVATGFKKWGMTSGTVAAMLLRDHLGGHDNPWARLFDATRLNPKASARAFLKENLDVAARFVGDRISTLRPPSVDNLAPGEAGLCDLEGERVAAYRDKDGRLHAVSPRCTHLGCLVAWNTAERTWDCPCHGSRFDCDGGVLRGPAVRALGPVSPPGATPRP